MSCAAYLLQNCGSGVRTFFSKIFSEETVKALGKSNASLEDVSRLCQTIQAIADGANLDGENPGAATISDMSQVSQDLLKPFRIFPAFFSNILGGAYTPPATKYDPETALNRPLFKAGSFIYRKRKEEGGKLALRPFNQVNWTCGLGQIGIDVWRPLAVVHWFDQKELLQLGSASQAMGHIANGLLMGSLALFAVEGVLGFAREVDTRLPEIRKELKGEKDAKKLEKHRDALIEKTFWLIMGPLDLAFVAIAIVYLHANPLSMAIITGVNGGIWIFGTQYLLPNYGSHNTKETFEQAAIEKLKKSSGD